MLERRYQVFVSSTFNDLKLERRRVLEELTKFRYIAAGMEHFPAIDEAQFDYIKTVIQQSDYYVVILAGKYGSLASDGIGYVEKEYDYAVSIGLPVIALIRQDIGLLDTSLIESSAERLERLDAFRTRILDLRMAVFWTDVTDLCLRLVQSLQATVARYPRPGWVRGPFDIEHLQSTLEEQNQQLENFRAALAEQEKETMIAALKRTLSTRTLELTYTAGATEEQTTLISMLDAASLLVAELGFDTRTYASNVISIGDLPRAAEVLVRRASGDENAAINKRTVSEVERFLENYGLASFTEDGTGAKSLVVTKAGRQVAASELSRRAERAAIERATHGPTFRQIGLDLGLLLNAIVLKIVRQRRPEE
jgi:hypothetical protein